MYTENVNICYENDQNIFMIIETHVQETEDRGYHLKIDSIHIPASAIITFKENETFDWLKLTAKVC